MPAGLKTEELFKYFCRVCTVNQHLCNRSAFFLGNSALRGSDDGSLFTPIKSRKILNHDKDTSATPAGLVYDITQTTTHKTAALTTLFLSLPNISF